jgi:hypothetical protein
MDKSYDDLIPNKRFSIDSSKIDVTETDDDSTKKIKKQSNQQRSSKRYRESLKEKSKKVEKDLKVETDKQERLQKIFFELQTALNSLSQSIVNQTNIKDTQSLLNTLKNNNLIHTAKKIEEIQEVKEVKEDKKIIKPVTTQPTTEVNIPKPVIFAQTPAKHPIFYDDEDCQMNRFQELFINDNLVNQPPENICNLFQNFELQNIEETDPIYNDFSFLFNENRSL